jgi:hypothetical protein
MEPPTIAAMMARESFGGAVMEREKNEVRNKSVRCRNASDSERVCGWCQKNSEENRAINNTFVFLSGK